MPLRLRPIFKNTDWLYQVCADADSDRTVLETVVTGVGWYSLYFTLTHDQVALADSDVDAFTELVRGMTVDKGKRKYADQLIDLSVYDGEVEYLS